MVYARQRWETRNLAAHTTTNARDSYKHTRVLLEIQQLYNQKDEMMQTDTSLLSRPLNEITQLRTHQIQRLIRQIAPIVQQSKQEVKKLGKH